MAIAELKIRFDAQPGLDELRVLVATLEQVLEDAPSFGLQVCNLLFSGGDGSLKPGLIEFRCPAAGRADDPQVVELHVTDRFREIVAAAAAGNLDQLVIN